jgi:protein-tyrosine phosphatase
MWSRYTALDEGKGGSMSDQKEEDARVNLSRVTEWLLIGGEIASAEHMAQLAAQGVTTIINAACEVSDRKLCDQYSLGYYHLYWYDDQQLKSAHEFLHVLSWVGDEEAKLAEAGRPFRLYVHCQMGINRGPMIATFLLAARQGLSADEAWERIKASRPAAHSFEKAVYRVACLRALEAYSRRTS